MELEDRHIEALNSLLPSRQGPLTREQAMEAVAESLARRRRNSRDGGAAIEILHDMFGMSYREIEREFNGEVSSSSLQRWAQPPPD